MVHLMRSRFFKESYTVHAAYLIESLLGQHQSDNNRMIQLTDVFCVLLRYKWASKFLLQYAADYIIRDPIRGRSFPA
jgi:hypothetical protein